MNKETNKITISFNGRFCRRCLILFVIMQACGLVNAGMDCENLDPSDLLLNKITVVKKTPAPETERGNKEISNNKIVVVSDKYESNVDPNSKAQVMPTPDLGKDIKAELLQSSAAPIADNRQSQEDSDMQDLISKVSMIKVGQKEVQEQQEELEIEPESSADENDVCEQQEVVEEKEAVVEPPSSCRISPETLEVIKKAASDASAVERPLELAEIMFESGCYEEAASFYKEGLRRLAAGENKSDDETAWVLFQLGNCQKKSDPNEAIKTYRQLILQYPQSNWAEVAKAQEQFTQWYQKDMPALRKRK